jgi:glycosyltransferase involved in cell wall biosynthesis
MKKIGLYLGSEPSNGGTFQYGQTILDAVAVLPKNEFNVVVCYSSPCWEKCLAGLDITSFHQPLQAWELGSALWWRRLGLPTGLWRNMIVPFHPFSQSIIHSKCDIWIFPAQDIWSYRIPVPALTTVFDLMHRYEKRFSEVSTYGRYLRREAHYKDICKWSKGILTDSDVGKKQFIESYDADADCVYPLPTIPPKYIYSDKIPDHFDSRFSLPEKFIFYPAQFWSHKNHESLIRAMASLKQALPDLQCVFVGSKKNGYNHAFKLTCDLGLKDSIRFLGYVSEEDITEIYRRARALVMPTFFGPTNIPPLEAFVLGCPVAVSGIYGMSEQVGDAALLFDPNSVKEIADAVYQLWTDDHLCRRLSEKGLERVKIWGPVQFAEKLEMILRTVLDLEK